MRRFAARLGATDEAVDRAAHGPEKDRGEHEHERVERERGLDVTVRQGEGGAGQTAAGAGDAEHAGHRTQR